MSTVVQLRVVPHAGGWRITVGGDGTPFVEGLVPATAVEALHETLASLQAPPPRVLVAGRDVVATRREDARGLALARALAQAERPWGQLQRLRGRAESADQPLVLAIDVETPELRRLPWELVALGEGSLEGVGGGLVVRMAPGPIHRRAPSPTVALFAPDRDDPATAGLLANAREALAHTGLAEVALEQRPTIVHVVAHGHRASGAVAVALGDGAFSAGTVSARLGDALKHASVVLLAVCHGGAVAPEALDGLADRLLASGIPLVLAPRRATATEAAARLAGGLYQALGEGQSLGGAVAAARREVRAWGHPHPSSRWWAWAAWTSSTPPLSTQLVSTCWIPSSWPTPAPDAAAWLRATRDDAIRRADGYVGLEHLLSTLPRVEGGGTATEQLLRISDRILAAWTDVRSTLEIRPGPPTATDDPAPTPRLSRWGARLSRGFDVEALASLILQSRTLPSVSALPAADRDTHNTYATNDGGSSQRATLLQVTGGPEDGRLLRPADQEIIGRAGGAAHHALFEDTRLLDIRLSRRHCRWIAPSSVHLLRAGVVVRREQSHSTEGRVDLRANDMLALSNSTRLLALSEEPGV